MTNITMRAAISIAGVVLFSALLGAGKPVAEVPLVISFGPADGNGLTSDGFTAPGYSADYANGAENVLAVIQGSGNLRFGTQFDSSNAATRAICIEFGDQFAAQELVVPFVDGLSRQCVNVLQPMHAYPAGDVSIASLRYGQSVQKLTRFEWNDGSYRYRIGYGTDMNMDGVADSPAVGVTCIAPDSASSPCASWVLAPTTDGAAALFRFKLTNKRGTMVEGTPEFVASVVMPFTQTFSRK
jgi:hypothetical protein